MLAAGSWLAVLAHLYRTVREPSWARDPFFRLLNDALVWGPLGTLLGIYGFVRGFLLLKRKRLIMNTPRSTVRGAALGPVEVSGKADGPYTLIAPLSETDCCYYRLVTTHVKDKNKKQSLEQCAPFFLNDGTGKVMIDPGGAEIQFSPLATLDSTSLPDYLRHFLVQHGISVGDLIKVEEFCIRPEDKIVVFGTLLENRWPRPQARDPAVPIGPGFLSEAAAELQHRAVLELHPPAGSGGARNCSREFDLHPPVLLAKGNGPFFISTISQQDLVKNLAFRSALYIWGGPLVALFSTYFLVQRVAGMWPR